MWRLKRWLHRGLTVLRWLLFPVLAISLLLGMCVPAAAAGTWGSYERDIYDIPGFSDLNKVSARLDYPGSEGHYLWPQDSSMPEMVSWVLDLSFTLNPDDHFRLSTILEIWSNRKVSALSIALCNDMSYYLIETMFPSDSTGNSWVTFNIDIDYLVANYTWQISYIQIDLLFADTISGSLVLWDHPFKMGYGDPNSPEYPSFAPPSGGAVSDLDAAESSLTAGAQDGIDKAGEAFAGVDNNLAGYMNGLLLCSKIMGSAIVRMPWLGTVIEISLALGLFASLLGLAAALIGASERRAAAVDRKKASAAKEWERTQSRYGPRFFRRRHK